MTEKMILVLSARNCDFADDAGKPVKGAKVFYIDFSSDREENIDLVGLVPTSVWLPQEKFRELLGGTGFYSVTLGFDLTGNKPKVVFEKFRFLSALDFSDLAAKIPKQSA